MIIDPLLMICICLIFSGFFSGMEIAYISADKLRIEMLSQKKGLMASSLSYFQRHRARFLSTTLVGNNLALVLYGILMATLLEPRIINILPHWIDSPIIALVIQTLIATFIVLITAEFLPKSLFLLNPDTLLRIFSLPMMGLFVLMSPLVWMVEIISKFIVTRIFQLSYAESQSLFALTDLNNFVKKNTEHSEIEDQEIDVKFFNNAIEFKEIQVRECMIPRTEIIAVDINDDLLKLSAAFIDSGHSKIIVYKENIDNVIGYCHSLEMFKKPKSIKDILTTILIIPETMPANELLVRLIADQKSLALVVDEFGGTAGLVSIEDVMEEIFGEIRDEHDDEFLIEQKIAENIFLLSARHEIDALNEKYNWSLPKGDYDTLGGLILAKNEDIPTIQDEIGIDHFLFQIINMEDNRIDQVRLTIQNYKDPL
ncbi:hemolysin family protein [Cyclobacteriaceae bacterium]|jgi:putative hemolysin|nr:hemolysin family protein [Cyclobacteriaceae bacterium]MDB4741852.1 hemolysin family protein [Cyclobacteriaceae bacterium]MDC1368986.1 hemolysin family protein [Cyclobacteriaceae bacterium]